MKNLIKIFSFVASCAGNKSHTARYSDELAETFRQKAESAGESVNYERMTGDQIDMKFCRSCNSCFVKGVCPLDGQDDMAMLKEKMLACDVLFFGSPVYLWEMSGMAKCVLDRISYWAHRYELAGKVGVFFTTTSSSYGQEIADRMAQLFSFMGISIAHAGAAFLNNGKPNIFLAEQMKPAYEEISDKILAAYRHPENFINQFQEDGFFGRKVIYGRAMGWAKYVGTAPWNEHIVCKERGVFKHANLKEYAKAVAQQNREDNS